MIDVRNHRHVTDVGLLVHDGTDLVNGKVHLERELCQIVSQRTREKQTKKGMRGCPNTVTAYLTSNGQIYIHFSLCDYK